MRGPSFCGIWEAKPQGGLLLVRTHFQIDERRVIPADGVWCSSRGGPAAAEARLTDRSPCPAAASISAKTEFVAYVITFGKADFGGDDVAALDSIEERAVMSALAYVVRYG